MKVVVLNDGSTFSNIRGCRVIDVPIHLETEPDLDYIEDMYNRGEGQEIEDLVIPPDDGK